MGKPGKKLNLIKSGRIVGLLLIIMAALTLVFSEANPLYAHANLVRTDPSDGSTLAQAPKQVRLWFNDALVLDFTRIELIDGDGHRLPLPPVYVDSESSVNASIYGQKSVVLAVDLPELTPNAYRLNWQVRSEDDLHVINGSTVFGIQRAVSGAATTETAPATQPGEVALRWLSFIGLAGLVGMLALTWLGLPPYRTTSSATTIPEAAELNRLTRKRLLQLAFYSGVLAFGAGLGLLLVEGFEGSAWWLILSHTAYGMRWWLGQLFLALLLFVLWRRSLESRVRSPESVVQSPESVVENAANAASELKTESSRRFKTPDSGLRTLDSGLLLALVGVQAVGNHSGGTKGLSVMSAVLDGLHLLGASLWVGGLLGLVLVIVPLLKRDANQAALAWTVLRRFGWLAAGSVVVLGLTGLYKSSEQVASLDALLTTFYGQALLLKVELVLLVGVIGLLNTMLLHPRMAAGVGWMLRRPAGWKPLNSRYLRRLLIVEATFAIGVLLLAAVLSATQPARGPEFDPPPTIVATTEEANPAALTTNADDLVLNLSVKPNRPGQNFLTLSIFNTRKPIPAPFENVVLLLRSPEVNANEVTLNAEALGNGRYQIAGGYFKVAGDWQIRVSVKRRGLPETTTSFPWKVLSVQEAGTRRPVIISNQPLAPWLNLIALGLAGVIALGLAGWGLKRWWSQRVEMRRSFRAGFRLNQSSTHKD